MSSEEMQQRQLSKRYAQNLPDSWWSLRGAGCFDPHHAGHLQLSDLQWLSVEQMLAWRFPADQVDGLLPFAVTANEDSWCLFRGLASGGDGSPVVFCPHEDEVAFAYAPHFTGFLFRAVLEEYACTCLTEHHAPGRSLAILGDYGQLLATHIPGPWAAILLEVGNRPLMELEHGYFGTISPDEAQSIISREFAGWADYEVEFEQFLGN